MAYAYHVYRVDPGSEIIRVEHVFYGRSKAECLVEYRSHLETDDNLCAADACESIEDEWEELTEGELPTANEDDDEEEEG